MLRITEVHREPAEPILDAAIDTPGEGWADGGHAFHLNGWVLGREEACTSVEVVHRDTVLRTIELGVRPDIAAVPAYAQLPWAARSGFSTGVGTLGLPEAFGVEVRAVLAGGRRSSIATIRGTRSKLVVAAAPRLRPLMVTCLGRSGTTLLMELLSGHPSVVVHSPHPYETRCATYWMQMAKVAGEPGTVVPPVAWYDQLSGFDAVRPVPFFGELPTEEMSWLTSTYTERLASFCVTALGDFYAECARIAGKPHAVVFAEKQFPGLLADVLSEVCPSQPEIVSIRDPRDMLLSIFSFLDSGHTVLSHTRGDARHDVVDRFSQELRLLSERSLRPGAIVVRYEDLVEDQSATLQHTLKPAGLSASDAEIAQMRATSEGRREHYERHRTTRSLEDSIGRWRSGDESLSAVWTPELEELTVAFGYPPTTNGGRARLG